MVTQVAEEGLDIQACGHVVRWDLPVNMVSWAQSRGRARRQRSTFVLLYQDEVGHFELVRSWEKDEDEARRLYNDQERHLNRPIINNEMYADEEDDMEFLVESTGSVIQ